MSEYSEEKFDIQKKILSAKTQMENQHYSSFDRNNTYESERSQSSIINKMEFQKLVEQNEKLIQELKELK